MNTNIKILQPNITHLCFYLKNLRVPKNNNNYDFCGNIYGDKFIIEKIHNDSKKSIRIWKSKTLLNWWYNDMCSSKFIAALDYSIHPEHVKIDYLNVNDDDFGIRPSQEENSRLSITESTYIHNALLKHVKNYTKNEGKTKIIIDVHSNLKIFNKYYFSNGFKNTNRKCIDNPFWLEAEFVINP